jgi:plastocyanin
MRKVSLSLALLLAAPGLFGEDVTLPAAASIVGGAPFFSDVRAFNTSYASGLNVTARYRCFIPSPCTSGTPEIQFTLAPRESRSFDDMVATTFQAPNTAGGVEFEHGGGSDQLVVTSRLYSTAPQPTVGMFIPGLKNNEAHARTVLTSIRNGGPNQGFRTNVGAYNREDAAVTVTFTIFDGGAQVGTPVSRPIPGHSGVQVSGIFGAAGQGGHVSANAVVVVAATGEVFSYAAVLDNNTTDPIFVRGAEDTEPGAAGPLHRTVRVGENGSVFKDDNGGGAVTSIHVGDTVTWVWGSSTPHGVTSGQCTGGGYYEEATCDADGHFTSGSHQAPFEFTQTFTQAGTFQYFCPIHKSMMRGRVIVAPPGGAPAPEAR